MKLLTAVMLLSISLFANANSDILIKEINKESIELFSKADDLEIVTLKPYWKCGPCKLFEGLLDRPVNDERMFDARTILGRFFTREVSFKSYAISDEEAISLGIKGYPSTAVFKEGQFLGIITGAISLRQLGNYLDRLYKKNKFERRAERYLSERN